MRGNIAAQVAHPRTFAFECGLRAGFDIDAGCQNEIRAFHIELVELKYNTARYETTRDRDL